MKIHWNVIITFQFNNCFGVNFCTIVMTKDRKYVVTNIQEYSSFFKRNIKNSKKSSILGLCGMINFNEQMPKSIIFGI
jgi:hypothetical protein